MSQGHDFLVILRPIEWSVASCNWDDWASIASTVFSFIAGILSQPCVAIINQHPINRYHRTFRGEQKKKNKLHKIFYVREKLAWKISKNNVFIYSHTKYVYQTKYLCQKLLTKKSKQYENDKINIINDLIFEKIFFSWDKTFRSASSFSLAVLIPISVLKLCCRSPFTGS